MFRRIGWQSLLVGIGFLFAAGMLVHLAATYTTDFRPAPGGTYVESVGGYPQTLNPLLSFYNDADADVTTLVFSGLTRWTMDGAIEPDLALGWEIDPGGITYTFHINPRALWHDGVAVSADDVLFTVGLLQDPDYPGPPDIGALWRSVHVEKVDDLTVRFTLQEPYAPFLDYTTIGLLPAHLLDGIRAGDLPTLALDRQPIGSGPFRITGIDVDNGQINAVMLKRFPRYPGPKPYLENVTLRFYPTQQAAFEAYEAGNSEGVAAVPPALLPRVWEDERLNLYSAPYAEMGMLYLNEILTQTLPFDKMEVRRALLYALDRQALINEVLEGQALVPQTPLIPGTWAYDDSDVRRYAYDPQQAEALLTIAGWTRTTPTETLHDDAGRPLSFTLMTVDSEPDRSLAQAIAQQWEAIGISVTVDAVPPLALGGALEGRSYEAALVRLALPGDPDPYPLWHETEALSGQNYTGFRHRRISEIIEQARRLTDRQQRRELYHEFQQRFMDEVPALPLFVPIYNYAVDRRVHDVQIGPLMRPSDRFRSIADWYVLQRRVIVSERR